MRDLGLLLEQVGNSVCGLELKLQSSLLLTYVQSSLNSLEYSVALVVDRLHNSVAHKINTD